MKLRKLKRVSYHDDGTFGVLLDHDGEPFAVTLELPWRDNAKMVSCIPVGLYRCKRVMSPKFGDTFEITDVPGRSAILFHKANVMKDLHGCVGVGEMFQPWSDGSASIQQSGAAFSEFLTRTASESEFWLEVSSA